MTKMVKYIFPLSYRYDTPKKMFVSLLCYILIYIIGRYVPIIFVGVISSVYVFIGGGILMVNYILKNKGDSDGAEK